MSSIYGIGGLPRITPNPFEGRTVGTDGDASRTRQVQSPVAPPTAPETAVPKELDGSVPADPPPGTDPALWTILTGEERRFFARASSMGPLTYGPRSSSPPAAGMVPGGRIDLKV